MSLRETRRTGWSRMDNEEIRRIADYYGKTPLYKLIPVKYLVIFFLPLFFMLVCLIIFGIISAFRI
jgi:hypothetical protein